jgi:hypothetical protein
MHTPKHFVNLTGELNYKMVIFLSQTESTPKHFFKKKSTD